MMRRTHRWLSAKDSFAELELARRWDFASYSRRSGSFANRLSAPFWS
jgi:hypothetical protein